MNRIAHNSVKMHKTENSLEKFSMAIFDQRYTQVTYQYNAAGNIDIGAVQNKLEWIGEIKKLRQELETAIENKALDQDSGIDAEYQLKKAISQAEKSAPDQPALIEHLSKAKELVSGVSGLAGAIGLAIETITGLF
ncbi:MAG: hypothetical protein ACRER2_04225 [Methylococcales bacterium]